MKNKKLFIVLGVILGIIMVLIATYFILLTPSSKSNKVITFTVKKGDGKEKIVDNLKDAKLIRSKYAAIIYLVISGNKNLQAGSYEFSRDMSTQDIIKSLNIGAPTISHHIKELSNAQLIFTEKKGKFLICRINENLAKEVSSLFNI